MLGIAAVLLDEYSGFGHSGPGMCSMGDSSMLGSAWRPLACFWRLWSVYAFCRRVHIGMCICIYEYTYAQLRRMEMKKKKM